ncbi:alkaline shock response membrane anchor protein AmaP [Rothia sp. AR01]|uniref:Alkaline shock response membrane anchor protein AmaP n=1 Tax=Rothia santali TaxID=2949643 RepID=A0A9X2HIA1_9MICC|nr:alkaline shock response membrane anchor protein AmaP [Rothia santali]MCP3425373.1 alkaline shock response membrane anchor protein AmaP [Rothia santali]
MRILAGALNRTWLTIIGLVLLVAGAAWLLAAAGVLAPLDARLDPGATPLGGVEDGLGLEWLPAVLIAAAALLALLALAWLGRQVPRRRQAPTLQFHRDAREGVTLMDASVISEAVARDVEELEHVTSARAVLRGGRSAPELTLRVVLHERGDAQEVLEAITGWVLPRAVRALGAPLADVGVEVAVTRQSRRREHVRVQ